MNNVKIARVVKYKPMGCIIRSYMTDALMVRKVDTNLRILY